MRSPLAKNNNLTAPNSFNMNNLGLPAPSVKRPDFNHFEANSNPYSNDEDGYVEEVYPDTTVDSSPILTRNNQPIIIQNPQTNSYEQKAEAVDASLNLADK